MKKIIIKICFRRNTKLLHKINYYLRIKKKKNIIFKFISYNLYDNLAIKNNIIIGLNSEIGENISFPHMQNIIIGDQCTIGNDCIIYHDVTIGQNRSKYPIIGDNVIIYTGAKILGGVSIGNNVIIGANSVVIKDIPDNAIVAGCPARIVKYRSDSDEFY